MTFFSKITFLLLFLVVQIPVAEGQKFDRFVADFSVKREILKNPLTGGMNAPQFSAVDLNGDGILDLHIFDRIGEVHNTFINGGAVGETDYTFAPEYRDNFPTCVNWVALRDYDGDGAYDIFTHHESDDAEGIRVFKGKFTAGKLDFNEVIFNQNFPENILTFPSATGETTSIYVGGIDYPDFNDVDNDGDLDILTFGQRGDHLFYYQNQSAEQGFGADSLIFILADNCWGRFQEMDSSEEITLGENPDDCPEGLVGNVDNRHQGSSLLSYDQDGDGDKELIIGDVTNAYFFKLKNDGDTQSAFMSEQDLRFPANSRAVNIPYFPAAFILDLDNDGAKDLVACPNQRNSTLDYHTAWFYKNTGDDSNKIFEQQQTDFLVDEMVDFGTGSAPAFADVTGDGLLDLVVGNFSYFEEDGSRDAYLFLFENTGTATQPTFELTDDNWLDFNRFSKHPDSFAWAFCPTFGDLDADGDLDLLVGERFGRLIYAENTAGAGNPMTFASPLLGWQSIEIGLNAKPQIVDLNRDSLPDLVIGERRGKINYFPNIGTARRPAFHPMTDEAPNNSQLGKIRQTNAALIGNLAPVVLDQGNDFKIIAGWEGGNMLVFENIENNLAGEFSTTNDFWGEIFEGAQSTPAIADLTDDGFLEMIIGNKRGGLSFFKTDLKSKNSVSAKDKNSEKKLSLYPNPTGDILILELKNSVAASAEISIFNTAGQTVFQQKNNSSIERLDLSDLPSGIYFCRVSSKNGIRVKRFFKK